MDDRLSLFVYGTLKLGERNHDRYCQGFASVEEATVRGRLYDLPFGFPGLFVPLEDVQAVGTGDYLADTRLSHGTRITPVGDPEGWDVVHGELLVFEDLERRLPRIDGLEGFRPGEEGFYTRVLIPVTHAGGETMLAWAYSVAEDSGARLSEGVWPAREGKAGGCKSRARQGTRPG